jgi:hypothetical protein
VEAVQELGLFAANITDQDEVDRIAIEKGYVNRDEVNQYCSNANVISLPSLQKL